MPIHYANQTFHSIELENSVIKKEYGTLCCVSAYIVLNFSECTDLRAITQCIAKTHPPENPPSQECLGNIVSLLWCGYTA